MTEELKFRIDFDLDGHASLDTVSSVRAATPLNAPKARRSGGKPKNLSSESALLFSEKISNPPGRDEQAPRVGINLNQHRALAEERTKADEEKKAKLREYRERTLSSMSPSGREFAERAPVQVDQYLMDKDNAFWGPVFKKAFKEAVIQGDEEMAANLIKKVSGYRKKTFEEIINLPYEKPWKDDDMVFIGVSGGCDSAALAVIMCKKYPNDNIHLVFTDTGAEPIEALDSLIDLEKFTGKKIQVIESADGKGLYDILYNESNYLPGHNARWCTPRLKTKPLTDYFDSISPSEGYTRDLFIDPSVYDAMEKTLMKPGQFLWSLSGINSDEPHRVGYQPEPRHEHFIKAIQPLREMGVNRDDVFTVVEESIGVPMYYRWKSRSGCSSCYMNRIAERFRQYKYAPEDFQMAKGVEKLSPNDLKRFEGRPTPAWVVYGLGRNWLQYPRPTSFDFYNHDRERHLRLTQEKSAQDNLSKAREQAAARLAIQGKKPAVLPTVQMDLIAGSDSELKDIYALVEFNVFQEMGCSSPDGYSIARSDLIAASTSKMGIQKICDNAWAHLKRVHRLWGENDMPELRESTRYVVYHLKASPSVIDNIRDFENSTYTLHSEFAIAQVEHLYDWIETSLLHAGVVGRNDEGKFPTDMNGVHVVDDFLYRPTDVASNEFVSDNDQDDPAELKKCGNNGRMEGTGEGCAMCSLGL